MRRPSSSKVSGGFPVQNVPTSHTVEQGPHTPAEAGLATVDSRRYFLTPGAALEEGHAVRPSNYDAAGASRTWWPSYSPAWILDQ